MVSPWSQRGTALALLAILFSPLAGCSGEPGVPSATPEPTPTGIPTDPFTGETQIPTVAETERPGGTDTPQGSGTQEEETPRPGETPTLEEVTETPATPPFATDTPGGSTDTPDGATDTPSGATDTPSGVTDTPSGATDTPSGATDTPDGATDTPPDESQTPVEDDNDGDLVPASRDCDDNDSEVYPGAIEDCDGKDNDCDGQIDEEGTSDIYSDLDGDGFGSGEPSQGCATGPGFASEGGDCDDGDVDINPGELETCDGEDDDCDGAIDDGTTVALYFDEDGDTYGSGSATQLCAGAEGYSAVSGDCDDDNNAINPGATEVCDKVDQDCDGNVDDGVTITAYVDGDGDGYGAGAPTQVCEGTDGFATQAGDCNDNTEFVYPGAPEACDTQDNDCDGKTDEDGQTLFYTDSDGDGYGTGSGTLSCSPGPGKASVDGDCKDSDPNINPGASEVCNSKDDNCNGQIDEEITGVGYVDSDGDGYGTGAPRTICLGAPGYSEFPGDCKDSDATVNPGANEVCNSKDDDCDTQVDEGVTTPFYKDNDGDGYGVNAGSVLACTAPTGYAAEAGDCNDSVAAINPGAEEVCNSKDDDCDNQIDEGLTAIGYADADGDTYGTGSASTICAGTSGYASRPGDCDDTSAAISPAATEVCNTKDDDCDGLTDESVTTLYYKDNDNDTYGVSTSTTQACAAPPGYAARAGDCDDNKSSVNPGATEVCNTIDDDCDALTDEGTLVTYYKDGDTDGYGVAGNTTQGCSAPSGYAAVSGDCNDSDKNINPGATEVCNAQDDDCDNQVDEGVLSTGYVDADGDTYGTGSQVPYCAGSVGYASRTGDCNDNDKNVNPGATEICNTKDDDCDGQVDEGGLSTFYKDSDGDGYGLTNTTTTACGIPVGYAAQGGDCNDADVAVNPGATEVCNSKDDDCDSSIDEGVLPTWYKDGDNDSYGLTGNSLQACNKPSGYTSASGDCNDADASVNPGATEVCNTKDDDCDSQVDENLTTTYYKDGDLDGYGLTSSTTQACSKPTGYAPAGGDCNDADATIFPGAAETCNTKDDNCNGSVDEGVTTTFYRDADSDGYGVSSTTTQACSRPSGYAAQAGDCNDNSSAVNPAAYDIPANGVDEDCDGEDATATDLDQDGFTDMILPNYYNGSSYVLNSPIYYGSESGFVAANRIDLPTLGARGSCVADFDEDGWLDVVLVNHYDGSSYTINSYLYWGSPSGFSPSDRLDLPSIGSQSCSVGDLDNDGDVDLVIPNYYDGSTYSLNSYVYMNVSGSFSRSNRLSLPTQGSYEVAIEDLNGDSYQELIFSGYISGAASSPSYAAKSFIYWGSATGYLSTNKVEMQTSGVWRRAAVEDVNNDGKLDVVLASHYNGSNYVTTSNVYYGPSYATSGRTDLPSTGSTSPHVEDFDKDGFVDILLPSYYDGDDSTDSYVYFGSSRGYSTSNRQALPSNRVYDVSIDDVDSDGYLDILMGVYYDGDYTTTSKLYYGSATGFSTSRVLNMSTYGVTDVGISDFDGDGWLDLGFASHYDGDYNSTGFIYWNSKRGVLPSARTDLNSTGGSLYSAIADLNADGFNDVITATHYSSSTAYDVKSTIFWGTKNGPSDSNLTRLSTPGAYDVCVGDLNKDGRLDLVFADYYNGSTYDINSYVYWNSSSGFSDNNRTLLPTQGALDCDISDLDGDGDMDLVFAGYYNGSNYTTTSYIYYNNNGVFSTSTRLGLPTYGARGITSEDLNNDGQKEIIFTQHYDGSGYNPGSYLYWGSVTGYSTSKRTTLTSHGPLTEAVVKDLNKDGFKDILIPGYYNGSTYSVNNYIYWGSSSGTYGDANRFILPAAGIWKALAEDLDKDGAIDIVLSSYYNGSYATNSYIYWGSGSGYDVNDKLLLPTYGSIGMTTADFNLDGYRDIVFASHYDGDYTGTSYVYYGSSSGYSTSRRTTLTSYGSYDAVAADLDSDGMEDLFIPNYYNGSSYTTTNFVYWNSLRGISELNYSAITTQGGLHIQFVE